VFHSPLTSQIARIEIDPSWEATLDFLSDFANPTRSIDRLVILVEGSKGTGKSTWAKMAMNRLLAR
jgi:polynucleotide 5'-kinase involved in rRNA processing